MPLKEESQQKRSVLGLLIAQFFGAFNDNAWKVMVFTLATRPLMGQISDDAHASFETSSQLIATLSLVVFLLPMMLFSLPAGAVADQLSKRTVIVLAKIVEVVLMAACCISLYLAPLHLVVPFILLGLMGAQSAFLGPAKYGILPEILPQDKLSKGNGALEMWTMIAIIAGTALGPMLLAADSNGQNPSYTWLAPLWLTILSCAGLIGGFFISRIPAARTNRQKVSASLKGAWSRIRADRVLGLAIIGSLLYWSMTSLLGQNILVYAKALVRDIEKGEILQGIPPGAYGCGIALGAFLAGKFSKDRIESGFIPLGAIGFSFFSLLLGITEPSMTGTVILLLFLGMSSGLLIVPVHALVQHRSPDEERGSIIALGNFLDVGGMILGSLIAGGMAFLGLGLKSMLIFSALMIIAATIWCVRILPKALVRLCFIILTHTIYKLRVNGLENLPKKGPMLLVANHVSIVDALFVMASVNRPVRFIMNEYYYNKWYLHPIVKLLGVIPVANTSSTKALLSSLRKATEALENGEVVCIFPEGQISHTGKILPFRRGIEVISKGQNAPIIPIHLDNVWGSIFSYDKGRFFKKWPQQFPYSLTVTFGKPLPSDTPLSELRRVIQEMEAEAWIERRKELAPIHYQMIHNIRKTPRQLVLADKDRTLKGWKVLTGAIAFARILKPQWKEQSNVGIMLPTCIPSIMLNAAATLAGRTSVNLNFTAGDEALSSAISQAVVKTVITSRQFIEKANCTLPNDVKVLYIEDLIKQISSSARLKAFLIGFFMPISVVEKYCGSEKTIEVNDTLTIIFTSGSTGEPKGVVLSHFNVSSNVEAVSQVIPHLGKKKNLLASLPLFHSFGYMMMWLGFNHRIGMVAHANPLEYKVIGDLVKKYKVKFIMSTPTFLQGYTKQVVPDQFGSLQCVIAGAEKLTERAADAFETHFGIRPMEGYGATECSPVIATNTFNIRLPGIYQIGTAQGSVGQAIPGVMGKIVDPDTFQDMPHDSEGLLLIKGPNVMEGYLNRPELTGQVILDGWYNTGDIAAIDQNGFITIKDRLRRISKIGGEMVPHGRVEEALHDAAEIDYQVFAVTAVPDEKKGEKLAVLHTFDESKLGDILTKLAEKGLSNLYLPRLDNFIKVEQIPVLGTGKLDLQTIKKIAVKELSC